MRRERRVRDGVDILLTRLRQAHKILYRGERRNVGVNAGEIGVREGDREGVQAMGRRHRICVFEQVLDGEGLASTEL
jgi:hypothetical protein